MLIVQKFGGSSLADIDRLRRAADICIDARQGENDLVVVVSAMGDETDRLVDMAHMISPRPSPRELDALTTTGEQRSAALMAIMLESLGTKACSLTGWQAGIMTDGESGQGDIRMIAPSRILEALSQQRVAVVTGYQGFCAKGDITSLGRGGSDTTAVALAAALEADRCEIYTDVAGIYTADPRLLGEARYLESIDFRDMLALSSAGSQVLHPRAVELAMANDVELRLLSSFDKVPGSSVRFLKDSRRPPLAGVTRCEEKSTVSLAGREADAAALSRMVLYLAEAGIPVASGAIEQGCVSVTVEPDRLLKALETVHRRMILGK